MDLEQRTSDERRKWEQPNYVPVPYPKMLYKVSATPPGYEHLTVASEREQEEKEREGWHASILDAKAYAERLQADIGVAAAERAAADRKLSAKAQAEAKAAEEANDGEHLAEVPEKKLVSKRKVLTLDDLPKKNGE
jgi:hypothetical protein